MANQQWKLKMQLNLGDVDIDVQNRNKVLNIIKTIPAAIHSDDGFRKHPTGVYVQDIPINPHTGFSKFDHKQDDDYQKIDFLNLGVLETFITNDQLSNLVNLDPDWNLLKNREIVEGLPHIHKWFDLLKNFNVNSVDRLAMFLGLIRPGKEHLRKSNWEKIEKEIWKQTDKYNFKKSHAYGYALMIVAVLNVKSGKK